jgi:hypothetical protein
LLGNLANPAQIELRPRWGENQIIPVEVAGDDAHGGADPLLLENFITSLRYDAPGSSTVRDGIRAVAVGQAAELSWRQRRMVEIAELVDLNDPVFAASR